MKYLSVLEWDGELIVAKDLKDLSRILTEKNIDINLCNNYELRPIKINNNVITYKDSK